MDTASMVMLLFSCAFEVFLIYDYFNFIFGLKIERAYSILTCVIACAALFAVNSYGSDMLNLVAFPVLMWVFVSVLFDAKPVVRLEHFVAAYVCMIGSEFLYLILTGITADQLSGNGSVPTPEYSWEVVFIKFLNFLLFALLKRISGRQKSRLTSRLFLTYLTVPVVSLCIMLLTYYSGLDFAGDAGISTAMLILYIMLMVCNVVLLYAFENYAETLSETAAQQMELMRQNAEIERLKKISSMNDTFRETIHNMSHSLKVIDELAEEHDTEALHKAVSELSGNLSFGEIYNYSQYKMLNTLLSDYAEKARKRGIDFDVYVEPGSVLDQVSDLDLVSMLGNLLDNAFTAAGDVQNDESGKKEQGEEKVRKAAVSVRIFMHTKGKMCVIQVVNDCGQTQPIISNGMVESTKKDKGLHGIGLPSVRKTAEKYNGTFHFYLENGQFHAVLILPV